jgi:hypothetical protein
MFFQVALCTPRKCGEQSQDCQNPFLRAYDDKEREDNYSNVMKATWFWGQVSSRI